MIRRPGRLPSNDPPEPSPGSSHASAAASRPAADLYYPPGHFYSPIVDPQEADRHLAAVEARGTPASIPGIAIDRSQMVQTWHALLPLIQTCPFKEKPLGGLRYGLANPYYSWGDGMVLQAMIRLRRPRRIVEIGSGWSSVCMSDTINRWLDGHCALTMIDPSGDRLRGLIGEAAPLSDIRILDCRVQEVAAETFDALQAGDILFIDSSHVLRTGSDVCHELFEILPRLSPGVLVHIHDIFWPFEYPRRWAVDENRSWNEVYAVRAFLTHNDHWRIVMFNSFMAQLERELIEASCPDFYKGPAAALWIERR